MKMIALTDDDPLILKTIKSLLNDKYKVVCLNSGKALLQYLKEGNRPDLILLDYLMPICDGPTTLELIREDKGSRMSGNEASGLSEKTSFTCITLGNR